jgi:hypothetical protein
MSTTVQRVLAAARRAGDAWSPRIRIGVAIDRATVRAVGIRFGRVAWGLETPMLATDAIGDAVVACLASRPGRRSWIARLLPPIVTVALGPAHAQTKRLVGLPPLADPRLLARAVHEHVGRFFLKNGVPLVTTSVRADGDHAAWAAAFEQPTVAAIAAACQRASLRLGTVVPAVDVLACGLVGLYDETLVWPDGDTAVAVTWSGGRLAAVRRASSDAQSAHRPVPVPVLAPLGDHAWAFAVAYGAVAGPDALAYRADGATNHVAARPASRRRVLIAATAASVALAAAALAPGLAARRMERRATARLVVLGPREGQARRVSRDLGLVTAALGEVASFEGSARVSTLLLHDLANALPPGAALLAIHMDSIGGSIVAVAPRAGAVVTPLDHVAWLASPEIVGPVTREQAGGKEVERVTVRFRWARARP